MKTLLAALLIGEMLWAGAARTEGHHTQKREAGAFQEIELHGDLVAEVTMGDRFDLALEGDDELVERTTSDVTDGRLVIMAPGGSSDRAVRAVVTLPRLVSVAGFESARASLRGFSGPHLSITLEGAAALVVQGVFNSYELSASGASVARLERLDARLAFIRLDTASRAVLAPVDQLQGTVSNASDAIYLGDRATANVDVDVASRFECRREP